LLAEILIKIEAKWRLFPFERPPLSCPQFTALVILVSLLLDQMALGIQLMLWNVSLAGDMTPQLS
jgi:hypothetical protein